MPAKKSVSLSDTDKLIRAAKTISGLKTKQAILNHVLQFYIRNAEQKNSEGKSFYEVTKHLAGSLEYPIERKKE